MREYNILRNCCMLVFVVSLQTQSTGTTVKNFTKELETSRPASNTTKSVTGLTSTEWKPQPSTTSNGWKVGQAVTSVKNRTSQIVKSEATSPAPHGALIPTIMPMTTKIKPEMPTFEATITRKTEGIVTLEIHNTSTTSTSKMSTISWKPEKRVSLEIHNTSTTSTSKMSTISWKPEKRVMPVSLIASIPVDLTTSLITSNVSSEAPTNASQGNGTQFRQNTQKMTCDNDTIFWFYDSLAYEENREGSHKHSVTIHSCETKENKTVNLTLYQFTTGTFPYPFWTDYAVLGFVVKIFPSYWVLYKLHVFAVMRSGDVQELEDVSANTSEVIPYINGVVHFDSWTNYYNNHGRVRFNLNGSVQMEPLQTAASSGAALNDEYEPLQATIIPITTKKTPTRKTRKRQIPSATPKPPKENIRKFTDGLLMLVAITLFILVILAIWRLLTGLSYIFAVY
ncbi:uncharacterized protein LOC126380568 isoform X2 [Pectinophora gossypiella]|uniref:uncharacterized protein LOC126380568 isoform X2 n=1 Tax=Pectinophora gossypiella TaxID=13191 RepID=UPI00214DF431|nr:uncharacterized protein LOC126380568 isoform X2 [Pectinophora gossypiella]